MPRNGISFILCVILNRSLKLFSVGSWKIVVVWNWMQYAIMLDRNDYGIIFGSFLLIRKDFLTHLCIFFSFFFFRSSFGFFVVFLFGIVICVVFGGVIDMFWVDDLILLSLFVFYFPYLNVVFFSPILSEYFLNRLKLPRWHFWTCSWTLTFRHVYLNSYTSIFTVELEHKNPTSIRIPVQVEERAVTVWPAGKL